MDFFRISRFVGKIVSSAKKTYSQNQAGKQNHLILYVTYDSNEFIKKIAKKS